MFIYMNRMVSRAASDYICLQQAFVLCDIAKCLLDMAEASVSTSFSPYHHTPQKSYAISALKSHYNLIELCYHHVPL